MDTSRVSGSVRARGTAEREQIADEMMLLQEDMLNGAVSTVEEVRQALLREFLDEIKSDEEKLAEVFSVTDSGSELERMFSVLGSVLFFN